MADLWLVQYLCPQRHALCAAPYERPADTAEIEGRLLADMYRLGLNPWCGLCGSRDLRFEHRRLAFTDWDDAMAALRQCQADQLLTRQMIEHSRTKN
jgi:hypothetical protein